MRPLRVYVQHKLPINAISAYRIFQPLGILEKMKKVEILEDDLDPTMGDARNEIIGLSDIAFTHAVPATVLFRDYGRLQEVPPRFHAHERIVDYAPPWVLDIDDVYDWVSPTNPAFVSWGVRDLNGELVGDGGKIVATLENGKQEVLYEDGKRVHEKGHRRLQVYSYRNNFTRLARLKTAINNMACITTTTDILKEHILREEKAKRVEVLPNCMHRKEFPNITPKKHRRIRVLWQGGGSHYDDWASVRNAMVEVTKIYPNIVWVVFGQNYTPLLKAGGVPEKNIEYHDWVPYAAHKYELALLGCDINLAMIEPNRFSYGKSGIKFYEASALKVPMPTLATNAPPYSQDIQDGVTGLLYDGAKGFVEKLGQLIDNPQLRRELASNAQDWVWENRDAEKWAPKMYELFLDVKENAIREWGDMREVFGVKEGDLVANNEYIPAEEELDAVTS